MCWLNNCCHLRREFQFVLWIEILGCEIEVFGDIVDYCVIELYVVGGLDGNG